MKYKKISQDDVYDILADVSLDIICSIDEINIVNIANLSNTSKCQTKKHIDIIAKDKIVELKCEIIHDEYNDGPYPQYLGI